MSVEAGENRAQSDALSDRHLRFCQEYVVDLNATRAAIEAGFSARTASSAGSRLLTIVKVRKKIRELQDEIASKLELKATDIIRILLDIVTADPNELTALTRSACRHCHGKGHLYQYRTPEEFRIEMAAWMALPEDRKAWQWAPHDDGGYGYTRKVTPHPDCPMCDGEWSTAIPARSPGKPELSSPA